MNIVDRGEGTPVVVIPGIQGRWEWMKPAIDALAERCRVLTFSLADEPTCGGRFDESRGFSSYVEQVCEALDAAGIREAAICGISYGGLIAAAFAVRHPERTSSLVLVSALPPSWEPDARVRFYLRAPRLLMPLFVLGSVRLYPEIAAAHPGVVRSLLAAGGHAWRVVMHMFSPSRMARRVHAFASSELGQELRRARGASLPALPVLIITGESALDRVVPPAATREYLQLWPRAEVATITRTGHLGPMMRPAEFAGLVVPFAERAAHDVQGRRLVG